MSNLETKMGKIITIEGGDRSGKHTQATLLYTHLKREGYSAVQFAFPQYDTFTGEMVTAYLAGKYGTKEQLGPKLPSVLYAINRFEEKPKLLGWLNNGQIVIMDRYIESNMAYQSTKLPKNERADFLVWLEQLEYGLFGLPKSDIMLYLHVPCKYAKKLAKKEEMESGKKEDIHEKDWDFQKKVVETYLTLAKDRNWSVIECIDHGKLLPQDKISDLIWKVVFPNLQKLV